MIIKHKYLFLIFLIISINGFTQYRYNKNTFKSGEKVVYNVFYKLGPLWFNAAKARFNITLSEKDSSIFIFDSYGYTLPNYDWIYKVRDKFTSSANTNTLQPLSFIRDAKEGNYWVKNSYIFDYNDSIIYSSISNKEIIPFTDTIALKSNTFDMLTAIYYFRNIDFSGYKINDTTSINILIDNKIYAIHIRYLGKEKAKDSYDKTYECIKLSALMVEGTIFNGGEDIIIWVTDDNHKIPVKVEAEILIGSVIAKLDSVKFGE